MKSAASARPLTQTAHGGQNFLTRPKTARKTNNPSPRLLPDTPPDKGINSDQADGKGGSREIIEMKHNLEANGLGCLALIVLICLSIYAALHMMGFAS